MSESNTIKVRVSGVGSSNEVEVEVGATAQDALAAAGIDAEAAGLNTSVDGERTDGSAPVEDGSQVVATPRAAKLG